jgi:hypothetical protein
MAKWLMSLIVPVPSFKSEPPNAVEDLADYDVYFTLVRFPPHPVEEPGQRFDPGLVAGVAAASVGVDEDDLLRDDFASRRQSSPWPNRDSHAGGA